MTEQTKESETPPEKPPETAEKPVAAQTWQKPPGYDPIDYEKIGLTPEQRQVVEARFNHLYAQAKSGTEAKRELREVREHLDKLTPVVNQLAERTARDEEARVAFALKQARETGDTETEIKLLRAVSEPKPEPKPEPKKDVTQDIVKAAEGWASETGDDGTLKRPWIMPTHPDHDRAMGTLFRLKNEWEAGGREIRPETMPFFLSEIDRRMGPKPNGARQPAVLSTAQIQPKAKTDEIELSEAEKFTANRLYSHLPDEKKRIEAYANAIKAQIKAGTIRR